MSDTVSSAAVNQLHPAQKKGRLIAFTQKYNPANGQHYIDHFCGRMLEAFPGNPVTYVIVSLETGADGYKHYQGFFRVFNPMTLGTKNIKKIQACLHEDTNAHLELCRCSFEVNFHYVTKGEGYKDADGKWVDHGKNVQVVLEQGKYQWNLGYIQNLQVGLAPVHAYGSRKHPITL